MENFWVEQCKFIISNAERESQSKYALSVKQLILTNSTIYPSHGQKVVLNRIWTHLKHKEQRELIKCLGLTEEV